MNTLKALPFAILLSFSARSASAVCPDPKMDEIIATIRKRLDVLDAAKEKAKLDLEDLRDPEADSNGEDYTDELGQPWNKLALNEKVLYTKHIQWLWNAWEKSFRETNAKLDKMPGKDPVQEASTRVWLLSEEADFRGEIDMIEGICKMIAEENLKKPGSWKGLGIPAISH